MNGDGQNVVDASSSDAVGDHGSPLSEAQLAIWLHEQLHPGSSVYHLAHTIEIDDIVAEHWKTAVAFVATEQPAQRTNIITGPDGQPQQVVSSEPHQSSFALVDGTQLDDKDIDRLVVGAATRSFDLARDPLYRITLIAASGGRHIMVAQAHHIISDLWSLAAWLDALARHYKVACGAPARRRRPLRLTPSEHAIAESEWLESPEAATELAYWLDQTVDLPETELPRSTLGAQSTSTMTANAPLSSHLDTATTMALEVLAGEHNAELADIVLAALGIALSRYGSTNDVVVGTLRARRTAPNARTMGMFANEVMLRLGIDEQATFAQTVAHVRSVNTKAALHDRLPLSTIARAIRARTTTSALRDRAPFDVSFGWQATGKKAGKSIISALALGIGGVETEIAGITFRTRRPPALIANAPLTFVGALFDSQLHLTATYQQHVVDEATAQRVLDHVGVILCVAAANAQTPVSQIDIIGDTEHEQLERLLKGPTVPYPAGTILDRFDGAVLAGPDRPASTDHNQSFTYAQASKEVDRIAGLLLRNDVGPGDYVAVATEPSAQLPLALLAILRCGAAYVPIDPRYPADRQAYMFADSEAQVAIVGTSTATVPPGLTKLPLVESLELVEAAALPVHVPLQPSDDAYLLYTSGSTGVPKGVRQTHRTLTNLVDSLSERPGFTSTDCMLAIASLSFDISIVELLMPLAVGGEVFVADPAIALDIAALTNTIEVSRATVFQATPATWRMLIDADWQHDQLRLWSQAEELTRHVADELLDRAAEVWNLYGPTETHDCTVGRVGHSHSEVSIGSPIANTQLAIVDAEQRLVPLGCRGELLVAGSGVANGYFRRPVVEAERFIHLQNQRWYRTGDLVTMHSDGHLRYEGRIDYQVKLRGHRIELGEIETTLDRHRHVLESVVLLHNVSAGDQRLVAYVVASTGTEVEVDTLHDHIAESLPSYMVPAAIEVLPSIPRLPNNKIDRSRLPIPTRWARRGSDLVVAPRTPTERALVRIWCEVLGHVDISIHDNFFDLGGHSLLATQIASRVRSRLGTDINLRAIYNSPTVAIMAVELEGYSNLAVDVVVPEVDRTVPLPLSYSQERMWFLHQLLPEGAGYNMAGALRIRGPLDITALEGAMSDAVVRHEALRTRFVMVNGAPRQIIEDPWPVTIELVDYRSGTSSQEGAEARLAEALTTEANRPFTLEALPLIRLTVHVLGDDEHVLFVNMHHIIGDEWSFGILAEEVAAAYSARLDGSTFAHAEPAVQHTNFAVWHRQWLDTGVMQEQLDYWRTKLDGLTPVELPTDRPRPRMLSGQGRNIEVDMSSELLSTIKAFAAQNRTSPYVVLLSGFKVLLHRHTGLTDLAVGSPIANRNTLQSERVISSLVNGVVMRTEIDGCTTFADVVDRVHGTALDAFTNQDMPFEKLVEELKPSRDPSRSPLFQIFFNVLTAPFEPATFVGTTVVEEHIERGAAQFDLTVTISMNHKKIAVDFSTDLFDYERIERLLGQYITVLGALMAEPSSEFGTVDLRTDEERLALASTWGHDSYEPFQDSALLHDLVHEQAKATPERTAAASEGLSFTYSELDRHANQIANHLISSGLAPGDAVGILLERSAWSVACMVGTNRAGCAFVPLDPDFPAERVQYMLDDSGARAILTSQALLGTLDLAPELVVCCPDTGEHHGAADSVPLVAMTSTDLAWIMYTSGSTGQPKGIEIEHRSAVNLFTSMAMTPGVAQDSIVMSVTSASFDPSIQDIYLPLLHGAMVYVAPQSAVIDARVLEGLLETTGATHMFSTPTMWKMLVEVGWTGGSSFVAQSGGEALPRSLAEQLLQRTGSVWNLYGLTETTIWSSASQVTAGDGAIAVGPPLANTSFHVLDANQQPCAAGIPGELYIGGIGVGRQFRNRPDLDVERIVDNPNRTDRHRRLYRTGDLATYHTDGRLLFRGRGDDQVKIRGRRVEIAEIEAALASHVDVERSAVTTVAVDGQEAMLAAYIVPSPDAAADDTSLREHLRRYLPEYMLPVSFTRLAEFPLTPNRKVDRKALPDPVFGKSDANTYVEPDDELEREIAAIWQRHLPQERIGRHDDFFELGGHSLLAVRVFADLQEKTGRFYPVAALFRGPTVAELANVVRADWRTPFTALVEVQTQGTKTPFFSVSPFLVTTLSYQLLARHLGNDQPLYAFQPQGVEADDPIHRRVSDMATHYIAEMKMVQPKGPYLLGGHCAGSWVAFEMATQLQEAGEQVDLLVLVDSEPPIVDAPERNRNLRDRITQAFARLQHFRRDGRLSMALAWQLGLTRQRFILRWTGGEGQKRVADVRATHRRAHAAFTPGNFDGDALFIRSQESVDLRHLDWHLRWGELLGGELTVVPVPGFHAALMLEDQNTLVMAKHISGAVDAAMKS